MIDSLPPPSRSWRLLVATARWSLRAVLALWLLVCILGVVLHGFIVPRIDSWRGQVERLATQALGTQVRIASIQAHSQGWFPVIELQQVQVLDAHHRPALELPRITTTVSARSLLRLGVEQLLIDSPVLDIRRLPDGQWQVAGLPLPAPAHTDDNDQPALRWLLAQSEIALRHGQVHFTDELAQLPTQSFIDVELVLRHSGWRYDMRLDATPEAAPHDHLRAMGSFRNAWLPTSRQPWQHWSGQWFVDTQLENLPRLPWPESWAIDRLMGQGQVRAWIDIEQGRLQGATADVALEHAWVDWHAEHLPDLQVRHVKGRLQWQHAYGDWQLQARNFSFQAPDGDLWPSSNWKLRSTAIAAGTSRTRLELDYADLGMAREVAQSLPLPTPVLQALGRWMPEGEIRQLQLQWQGDTYEASGQLRQVALRPQPKDTGIGTPGIEGLSGSFRLNQQTGEAQLDMGASMLHFPGVFERSDINLDHLRAQLHWQRRNGQLQLQVRDAQFSNADTQGHLQASWRTGDDAQHPYPGVLDLQGVLTRAISTSVHQYLPLSIPASARHYVRDSILAGEAENVRFAVQGDLRHMPFSTPGSGVFSIHAPVRGVTYQFTPASVVSSSQHHWPALTELQGLLVFEGNRMQVQGASGRFASAEGLMVEQVQAEIPDLRHPVVHIQSQTTAPLQQLLNFVRHSPLDHITSHSLQQAQSQGPANVAFTLQLPLAQLAHTQVSGHVGFESNQLQLLPATPALQQVQGRVHFSEQGFRLEEVSAQALGGTVTIEGGMTSPQAGVRVRARGTATAQGLRQATQLPVAPWVAEHAQGQSRYDVEIAAQQGQQVVRVHTALQGMQLDLPAPFDKHADTALPLSVTQTTLSNHTQELRVDVDGRLQASYLYDTQHGSRVVAGHIAIGQTDAVHQSAPGVSALVQLPQLDADAWLALLPAKSATSMPALDEQVWQYLPQRLRLEVEQLRWRQRQLQKIHADLRHQQGSWQAQLRSPHLAGLVQYHPASVRHSAGLVHARLDYLHLPQSEVQQLNTLHERAQPAEDDTTQPSTLPALDITVQSLQLGPRQLGRMELQAHNRHSEQGRQWVLERFHFELPEAQWSAHGVWGPVAAGVAPSTQLQFTLNVRNAGQLLTRLGMPDVIAQGDGHAQGQLSWQGSPITPHWPSMRGQVGLEVNKGQFLKVEPGVGKLLSVLSLQSISRRITLDFRDVFSQGFAFDFVRGDIGIAQGVAHTNNLQMKGLNAAVLMEGQAHLQQETQDLTVVVIPEINAMTASLAATAINPVMGLGSFLAQMFLRKPMMEAATRTFKVQGSWTEPSVTPVSRRDKTLAVNASSLTTDTPMP